MRSLMSARGVVPSEEAFSALAEAAAREGLPVAAYNVAVDARKLGFQLAPAARSAQHGRGRGPGAAPARGTGAEAGRARRARGRAHARDNNYSHYYHYYYY